MDKNLLVLVNAIVLTKSTLMLTLNVQGLLITGLVISEEEFYVETLREYVTNAEMPAEFHAQLEAGFLVFSREPKPDYLHLAGVRVQTPSGEVSYPSMRVDLSQVSGWTLGDAGSSVPLLQRLLAVRGAPKS